MELFLVLRRPPNKVLKSLFFVVAFILCVLGTAHLACQVQDLVLLSKLEEKPPAVGTGMIRVEADRRSLSAVLAELLPRPNSFFLVETSGRDDVRSKLGCALESVAKYHAGQNVYLATVSQSVQMTGGQNCYIIITLEVCISMSPFGTMGGQGIIRVVFVATRFCSHSPFLEH